MDFIRTLEEITILYLENRLHFQYKAQQVIDLVECRLKIIANLQQRGVNSHHTKISQVAEWKRAFFKKFTTCLGNAKKHNHSYKLFKDSCDSFIIEITADTSILADLDEKV